MLLYLIVLIVMFLASDIICIETLDKAAYSAKFRNDLQNTGRSAHLGPRGNGMKEKWKVTTEVRNKLILYYHITVHCT